MKIKLRPQWSLLDLGSKHSFVSETHSYDIEAEYLPIAKRLVEGIETSDLSDAEFDEVETLTARGVLTFVDHEDAPFWELARADFYTVSSQLKHVTFNVIDLTPNGVGEEIREILLSSGLVLAETPKLNIVVADSYHDIGEYNGPTLPIVCNRMRLQFGPIVFPWGTNVRDVINENSLYLPRPNYKLPVVYDKLQRAWLAMMVIRLIALNRYGCYKNIVEYNLGTQEFKLWPVKI